MPPRRRSTAHGNTDDESDEEEVLQVLTPARDRRRSTRRVVDSPASPTRPTTTPTSRRTSKRFADQGDDHSQVEERQLRSAGTSRTAITVPDTDDSDLDPLAAAHDRTPQPSAGPSRAVITLPGTDDSDFDPFEMASPPAAAPSSVRQARVAKTATGDPEKGEPYVDIPFLPLATLVQYHHAEGVARITASSRAKVMQEQDSGRSASPRAQPSRPQRQAAKAAAPTKPRWRVASSDDDDENDLGGYGDDSEDFVEYVGRKSQSDTESKEYSASEDEVVRRSTRTAKRARDVTPRQTRSSRQQPRDDPDDESASDDHMVLTRSAGKVARVAPPVPPQTRAAPRHQSVESSASFDPFAESEGESELDDEDMPDELESDYSPNSSPARHRSGKGGKGDKPKPTRAILSKHCETCEKCKRGPAEALLAKALKKKNKGKAVRKRDEDLVSESEEARDLQGWLECDTCTVSSHWRCLKPSEQKDVLNAFRAKNPGAPPRYSIEIDETARYRCTRCTVYPICFVCKDRHLPGKHNAEDTEDEVSGTQDEPIAIDDDSNAAESRDKIPAPTENPDTATPLEPVGLIKSAPSSLLFRCSRCKQAVHYEHLKSPFPPGKKFTLPELAYEYQNNEGYYWFCHCCRDWPWHVDRVVAWRPLPADALEPERDEGELPRYRDRLPREYLVKWQQRGFRHVVWVPHAWILAISGHKVRHFIDKGPVLDLVTDETLAAAGDDMVAPTIEDIAAAEGQGDGPRHRAQAELDTKWEGHGPPPDVNGEQLLPVQWSTVDRVLEVYLIPPKKPKKKAPRNRIESSDDEDEDDEPPERTWKDGETPPLEMLTDIDRWEQLANRKLGPEDVDDIAHLVSWIYVKWDDLQYSESCWDTPPPFTSPLYPAFKRALARYLAARKVVVPILSAGQRRERDAMAARQGRPPKEQPACIVGGTLMPFQIEGFQWLLYKHWQRQSCILADDMGLGKTIQVCSFLGYLCSEQYQIYPHLVVVPNSTITNWVREFEKWVPHVRVVPFYGEAASRKVVSKYEMYHPGLQGKADGLKAHVILTTYDTITGSDFKYFNSVPQWEVVIVDEGQRLKSDTNLIFNRLKQLNSVQRILLTGTPLNNNIRELFNLLNFLDEAEFKHLDALEERFMDLNETLLTELHDMIKPYILRRIKADVLKLPPKVEIIVPISMTPAQKRQTRLLMKSHADTINSIRQNMKKKRKLADVDAQRKKKKSAAEEAAEGEGEGERDAEGETEGEAEVATATAEAEGSGSGAGAQGSGSMAEDEPVVVEPESDEAGGDEAEASGANEADKSGATSEREVIVVDAD